MGYYAVEELENSFNRMKEFLFPIKAGTWLRLGLLVIFTGSGTGFPNFPTGGYGDSGIEENTEQTSLDKNPELKNILNETSLKSATAAFGAAETETLAGIGVALITLILLLIFISSVFEFVYYQSLIDGKVRIMSNFSKHLEDGLRYMILKLLSLILTVGLIAAIIAGLFINPLISFVGFVGAILLIIPVSVTMGIVNNFVIPETIKRDQKFWKSLRTVCQKARTELKQTVIYVLVRFGLKIVVGMAMILYMITVLIVLFLVFGIAGVIFYYIEPIIAAIPLIIGFIAFILAMIVGKVVVQTFLNYYALNVFANLGKE